MAADQHIKNMDMRMNHSEKMAPRSTLKPAQRPSVEIISPKTWQMIKGDSAPIEFQRNKGKVGEHIHAYVDGEMAGMFETSKGRFDWNQIRKPYSRTQDRNP